MAFRGDVEVMLPCWGEDVCEIWAGVGEYALGGLIAWEDGDGAFLGQEWGGSEVVCKISVYVINIDKGMQLTTGVGRQILASVVAPGENNQLPRV